MVIERTNMFDSAENRTVFKWLLLLMGVFVFLQIVRGSERFGSIIDIEQCSFAYWFIELLIFVAVYLFGRWHINLVRSWQEKEVMLVDGHNRSEPLNEDAISNIIKGSVLGGLYSGFGLGGGLFLVPMYKNLGLNPLQATASTSFNILITASINTIQAVFIGAIHFDELLYFVGLTALGSFFLSTLISRELQRRNRLSMVELALVILLGVSVVNIPYGMIRRYIQSGYDPSVIFGFGRLC